MPGLHTITARVEVIDLEDQAEWDKAANLLDSGFTEISTIYNPDKECPTMVLFSAGTKSEPKQCACGGCCDET